MKKCVLMFVALIVVISIAMVVEKSQEGSDFLISNVDGMDPLFATENNDNLISEN